MQSFEFGNKDAKVVLVQPVGDHDSELLEHEIAAIRERYQGDFRLIALQVADWNKELSPWRAPAVFGREEFGDGASETLREALSYCGDRSKTYYLGGYSLAGLFALWASYQTDVFEGVAAVSPSVWFPGFADYMREHENKCGRVYLSLGDREERTRNPVMATVGDRIREAHELLGKQGIESTLEWNEGNHFANADLRVAKGFAWVIR